jgi:hypothetical protein
MHEHCTSQDFSCSLCDGPFVPVRWTSAAAASSSSSSSSSAWPVTAVATNTNSHTVTVVADAKVLPEGAPAFPHRTSHALTLCAQNYYVTLRAGATVAELRRALRDKHALSTFNTLTYQDTPLAHDDSILTAVKVTDGSVLALCGWKAHAYQSIKLSVSGAGKP